MTKLERLLEKALVDIATYDRYPVDQSGKTGDIVAAGRLNLTEYAKRIAQEIEHNVSC